MKPIILGRSRKGEMTTSGRIKKYSPYVLAGFLLLSSLFFLHSYSHFIAFDEATLGKYFPFKWIIAGHIVGGATALLTGPFQFLKGFRNRYLQVHRILGRTYLLAILLSAICAFVLTLKTTASGGIAYTQSLQALVFAWLFTSYTAFATILKRQVTLHQQWMVRSYICTFAFIVQNYLLRIPLLIDLGTFAEIAPTFIWCSWTIPLLVYQRLLN